MKNARVLLTAYPRLFLASLEKRLKPRLQEAQNLGLTIDALMLRRIAIYKEDDWNNALARLSLDQKLKDGKLW